MVNYGQHSQIAYRNLVKRKLRFGLTVAGIAVGVALVFSLLSIAATAERIAVQQFTRLVGYDIAVFNGSLRQGRLQQRQIPLGSPVLQSPVAEYVAEAISSLQGVYAVSPVITVRGVVNGLSVTVQGIDLQTYVEVVGGVNIVEGKMFSCGNCSEAVVGRSLLLELNATVGSRLNLSIGSGVSEVLVSGVFETGMRIQEMVVYVPLDLVQKLAGMEGYATQILVKCESPRVVEAVVNSITSAFPGLSAVSMVAALQRVEEAVNTMTAFFLSIGAVALTAGGFGVMNTMFMAVVERTREIGILKSVGATDRFVFTLFITESALIGFTGSFTGLVVGIALSRLIPTAVVSIGGARSPGARSLQPPTNLRIAELVITPEAVSIAVVTGIAVATVAGLLPAYRAARMKPVEAVRYV